MNVNCQKFLLGAVLGASLLSGCAPLVVGGAVVGGMVAVDRRTSGIQLEDENIELKVASAINKELGERVHLNVTSYNRRVLLTGEVRTEADRSRATLLAQSQESVREVVNDLALGAPSSISQRTKDTVTTGQIKASFVDAKDLQSNAVKVVTERGVVYLMGRVTAREAQRATDIARGTSGVAKVVRVFEEISEQEMQRLSQPPLSR
jgi:osmotically-inducible protein OsmY